MRILDGIIYALLWISLGLFWLNPPSYTHLKQTIKQIPIVKKLVNKKLLDEKIKNKKPSFEMIITDKPYDFVHVSLKERLTLLSAKIGQPIFIRIFKEEALLEVWIDIGSEYVHLKDYIICAFSGDLGPKLKEGDRQAPEGFYTVKKYQLNPNSKFHLSFNLGYPNRYDKAHKRTGSALMVHGNCVSIGCFAMTDEKIEEIYKLVKKALQKGQKSVHVHAYPFRMSEKNMSFYEGNEWYDFWVNLKEGYDYFESQKIPPTIKIEDKRYEIYE